MLLNNLLESAEPSVNVASISEEFQIDDAPLSTPIGVLKNGTVVLAQASPLAKWLNEVSEAFYRPQFSVVLNFVDIPAGGEQDITLSFPQFSVAVGDFALISVPLPPSGCAYETYIGTPDEVVIRFRNDSAVPVTLLNVAAKLTIFPASSK